MDDFGQRKRPAWPAPVLYQAVPEWPGQRSYVSRTPSRRADALLLACKGPKLGRCFLNGCSQSLVSSSAHGAFPALMYEGV